MASPQKIAHAYPIYRRLFTYIRSNWCFLLIAMVASLVYSGIDAWFVYFLQPLLNKGLVQHDQAFLKCAPFLVLVVFMLRGIASFFSNYNIAAVSRNLILRLRQELFARLQRLPAKFYDHATSGQVLSVAIYSVEQVANAGADVLTTAIQASFLILGLIVVMVQISWKLTLLYFVLIPLIAVIMRIATKRVRRLSHGIQASIADITHHAEENIAGYKVVRAFGGEEFETEKFNKAVRTNRQREMKLVAARSWSVSAVQLIAAAALSITLYVAMFDINNAVLSAGGFVSMIAAMLALLKPMKDLTTMQNKLHRGLAGAQSVFELLDQPIEADIGTKVIERAQGKIAFSHVTFAYADGKPVLNDIQFTIQPGEVVALVGRSGSGKTSLISLLPRFYADYSGEIYLDDIATRELTLQSLRKQFAFVSQNVMLFNDTIANNIAYGCANTVCEADILSAAKAAYALDFIQQLPNGIHTLVGENGVLLSGGQRQRIAIARAILKNAPVLILDEATSALDTESERYIQHALESLMQNRTTLVIAHRLSTVERANKIIVLEQGNIVEAGTHVELLRQEGHYTKLYRMQFTELSHENA